MSVQEYENGIAKTDITYISEEGWIESITLPAAGDGIYQFGGVRQDGVKHLLSVKKEESALTLCAASPARLTDGNNDVTSLLLRDETMIMCNCNSKKAMIFVRNCHERDAVQHNYRVSDPATITIGRTEKNQIQYNCTFVSKNHAILQFQAGTWMLTDNSRNGTFVNGVLTRETRLRPGDVIEIFGLKMITGMGFLSVNDKDRRTTLRTAQLKPIDEANADGLFAAPESTAVGERYFHRSPRKRSALELNEIRIESPPMSIKEGDIPLLLQIGGPIAGMANSMLMGNILSMISSVLFPFLNRGYTEKQKQEYEEKRVRKYSEYLAKKEQEIIQEARRECQILNRNYPDLDTVLRYSENTEKLWERRIQDDDFMTVRVGSGNTPMLAQIQHPRESFSLETDELEERMRRLAEQKFILRDVPILHSFITHYVTGATGDRLRIRDFFYHVLMQIVMLHSYDEVKTVFLLEPEDMQEMSFIRYLPHVWNDQKTMRFIAVTESEAFQIGEYLKEQLGNDPGVEKDLKKILQKRPYYMVFALNRKLLEAMEILKEVMELDASVGVGVLALYGEAPKDSSIVFDLQLSGENNIIHVREIEKEDQPFFLDDYDARYAGAAVKRMNNTFLKNVTEENSLPRMVTFLEIFKVGRIDQLNIRKRWKENAPFKSLAVPVGLSPDGSAFMLDLHEKYQGPHGIVAGTTGSGKSEFLLTCILSLAINFRPDEVAFVLIDYKGGGLAGAFDDPSNGIHLPHLAGTITNLDGAAIARSLVSLHSEMTRRQKTFNEAKQKTGEGMMDIYTYQRLYREGRVPEPMPHLFIISDEFAELKAQQPEFLDELVSIARIGRSLGVHLILATQKPGGVVTDQILSNTKFRVCLKVQDRQDSMEMLKRPEASELRETGRFYLQVGSNELFAIGQSAWSGAPYEPQETPRRNLDDSIQVVDLIGTPLLEVKPVVQKESAGSSQLVEIVRETARLAQAEKTFTRPLWCSPLPDQIDIQKSNREDSDHDGVSYCAGLLDDPEKQMQHDLVMDFVKPGNYFVVGEPGYGKSTFIQSMLFVLTQKYEPAQIQFYILDYSSRLLHLFDGLPHCGGVLAEEQNDGLNAFFKLIMQIVNERKALFSRLDADSFESARKLTPIPVILVIIDNLAGMNMSKNGQYHFENLHNYIKSAGQYGIRFIISASHLNECPSRIRQELSWRIALRLKDKYEFFDVLDCRIDYMPSDRKGRGIYVKDGRPMEMQLARFGAGIPEAERIRELKEQIGAACERYRKEDGAKRLPFIPEDENYEMFCERFKPERYPLGFALPEGKPVALPFKQFSMLSVYFGNSDSTVPFFDNLLYMAKRQEMPVLFAGSRNGSCFERLRHKDNVRHFKTDEAGTISLFSEIQSIARKHHPILTKYCEDNGLEQEKTDIWRDVYDHMKMHTKPALIVIERFSDLCSREELPIVFGSADAATLLSGFSALFLIARQYRLVFVSGFYPDEAPSLNVSKLFRCYNPDKMIMLMGGNYMKQSLVQVPYGVEKDYASIAYNRCLMYYEGVFHEIRIPMEKEKKELEEDDRSIFDEEN